MKPKIIFVTGSDTGAGKTVLATLLTRHLHQSGHRVAALKPICSGGRDDARALHEAAGKILTLDEVNPWHFRTPLAPVIAARKEMRRVRLREVVAHIRSVTKSFAVVVVEGAGGLLSPLGEDFNSRDLIRALGATPIVVCPNRLGAVNQALLTLEALPRKLALQTPVMLSAAQMDASNASNVKLLGKLIGASRVHRLPRAKQITSLSPWLKTLLSRLVV